MKTLLTLSVLLISVQLFGQNKIGEATMKSTGKTIVIYDNNTWEYKNSSTTSHSTTPNTTISPNYIKSTPIKNTTSNNVKKPTSGSSHKSTYSSTCGARTQKGGACQRTVSRGGRCWQHGG